MTSDIFRFESPIPADELSYHWIAEYRKSRYLKNLTRQELQKRLSDIVDNMWVFDDIGERFRLNMHIDEARIYRPIRDLDWLRLVTDVYEEYRLRNIFIPDLNSQRPRLDFERELNKNSWAKRPDLFLASMPSPGEYKTPDLLFRYSKAVHNVPFIESGIIRVSPASFFNNANLNRAQNDNECIMEVVAADGHFEIDDYLATCFSSIYSYRMYYEFTADSCVIIKDVNELLRRFIVAIAAYNKKEPVIRVANITVSPIMYYDPYFALSPTKPAEIQFAKPLRYAYQHEYRVVMVPTKVQQLHYIDLELGPLTDIAELIRKD